MEVTKYSEDIQELINQCPLEVSSLSPNATKTIKKLLKTANEFNDNSLKSYVYYHESLYYYFKADIAAYRPLIKKAINCALLADDQIMLSRIYNFIAVDAHNSGCFDIAYNYYSLAYNYAEKNNIGDSQAIIESNLGRIYAELKNYKLARKFIRSAIKKYKKEKRAVNYIQTTAILKANDGIISLMLNDIPAAEKALANVEKIIDSNDKETAESLSLVHSLLATRLALKKNDKALMKKELKRFFKLIENEQLVQEYIDDINEIYNELMTLGMKKEAKLLIESCDEAFMSTDITYVITQFCEIKANYYESTKDEKKLFEVLKEQRKYNTKLRAEQQDMYAHSVSLLSMLESLREEQAKVKSENIQLKEIAEIDALTGIPNRFKMNQVLHDSNYDNKPLAIGILDIDYFKEYNDNYGHQKGDECLVQVANELLLISNKHDLFCARYGGDEFVIIYEGFSTSEIEKIAKELHNGIANLNIKHEYSELKDYITISQGICNGVPSSKNDLWDFLAIADEALYSIKKSRDPIPEQKSYKILKYRSPK